MNAINTANDTAMPLTKVHLYNGSKTLEAWDEKSPHFIDDWKPEERKIFCRSIQVTYGTSLRIFDGIGLDSEDLFFGIPDGYVLIDGVYYGDFEVSPATQAESEAALAQHC